MLVARLGSKRGGGPPGHERHCERTQARLLHHAAHRRAAAFSKRAACERRVPTQLANPRAYVQRSRMHRRERRASARPSPTWRRSAFWLPYSQIALFFTTDALSTSPALVPTHSVAPPLLVSRAPRACRGRRARRDVLGGDGGVVAGGGDGVGVVEGDAAVREGGDEAGLEDADGGGRVLELDELGGEAGGAAGAEADGAVARLADGDEARAAAHLVERRRLAAGGCRAGWRRARGWRRGGRGAARRRRRRRRRRSRSRPRRWRGACRGARTAGPRPRAAAAAARSRCRPSRGRAPSRRPGGRRARACRGRPDPSSACG